MEEEENKDIIDRISELPEPIWQHILSFLVIKDACRTSILSKTWKNACATLQFLNFYDQSFFPITRPSFDDNQEMFYQRVRELLNVVDIIIMKRKQQNNNVDIQKFYIQLPNYSHQLLDVKPYIEKFLSLLFDANGKIKELVFRIGDCDNRNPLYTLPEAVYAAEWFNKLNLGGFKLEYSASLGGCINVIKLHSLKELYLSATHVENQLFELLIISRPLLEILDVNYLFGLDGIRILGLLKLKRVRFYNCERKLNKIEIEAPNLEYLCHHGFGILCIVNVAACRT